MLECANKINSPKNYLQERALNMLGRELLLAESSDWAFLITTHTAVNYAKGRQAFHINAFYKLYNELSNNNIDTDFLEYIERKR